MDYIDKQIKMLEVGVNDERFPGASIKMWKSFFNDVDFIGFDINELTKEYEKYGVKIFIGDQGNSEDLENLIKTHGGNFDVIIDDGSHQHTHHILTFLILEPYLNQGGVYIIEDLHAYDGNLTKEWFANQNIKTKLLCNDKLLVYEK
jgi:demethylmacrocin O-methyltransferase